VFGFVPLPEEWRCYTAVSTLPPTNLRTSYGYLCHQLRCLAPLPIRSKEERSLFMQLLPGFQKGAERVDADGLALAWLSRVDGKDIFPKLPTHIEKHLSVYLKARNREQTLSVSGKDLEELFNRLYRLDSEEDEESNDIIVFNAPHVHEDEPMSCDTPFTDLKRQVPVLLSACPVQEIPQASSQSHLTVRTRTCAVCGQPKCPGRNSRALCVTPPSERVPTKVYQRKRPRVAEPPASAALEPQTTQQVHSALDLTAQDSSLHAPHSMADADAVPTTQAVLSSTVVTTSNSSSEPTKKPRQARTCQVCSTSQCRGAQKRSLCPKYGSQ